MEVCNDAAHPVEVAVDALVEVSCDHQFIASQPVFLQVTSEILFKGCPRIGIWGIRVIQISSSFVEQPRLLSLVVDRFLQLDMPI